MDITATDTKKLMPKPGITSSALPTIMPTPLNKKDKGATRPSSSGTASNKDVP